MHSDSISILQYNLNRSKFNTYSLLNDPTSQPYSILALQEQYWSEFAKSSLTHHKWTLIEPSNGLQGKPRSVIYVNNEKLSTNDYKIIHMPFRDITAVAILTRQFQKPVLLINIYNPRDHDLLTLFERHLYNTIDLRQYGGTIILGDFNLHHPLWNPPQYQRHDNAANDLVQLMTTLGLELIIPEGTVTFPRAGTAIDLVWGDTETANIIQRCGIASLNDHGSDHLPIEMIIDLTRHTTTQEEQRYNLKLADWKLMEGKIEEYLPPLNRDAALTVKELEDLTSQTIDAIAKAVKESTPLCRPSPFSKRW